MCCSRALSNHRQRRLQICDCRLAILPWLFTAQGFQCVPGGSFNTAELFFSRALQLMRTADDFAAACVQLRGQQGHHFVYSRLQVMGNGFAVSVGFSGRHLAGSLFRPTFLANLFGLPFLHFLADFLGPTFLADLFGLPFLPTFFGRPFLPTFFGLPFLPAFLGRPFLPAFFGRPFLPAFLGRPFLPTFFLLAFFFTAVVLAFS